MMSIRAIGLAAGVALLTSLAACGGGSSSSPPASPVLQSIAVTPNPFSTGVGVSRRMVATGTYSDGSTVDLTSLAAWSTTNPGTATVAGGRVSGVAVGTTTVSAALGAIAGSGTLSVSANTWSSVAPMLMARTDHTATVLPNGKVLVVGGSGSGLVSLTSAELYDVDADAWFSAGSLGTARTNHTATLLQSGKVLVVGGWQNASGSTVVTLASAELYDPSNNTWASAASLSAARSNHTATLLPDGKVLVVGGNGSLPDVETYDPVTNTWTPGPASGVARSSHAALLLQTGKVMVMGGGSTNVSFPDGNFSSITASTQIFDPATGAWSHAADMINRRSDFTATLLPSGIVVAAGGFQNLCFGTTGVCTAYAIRFADRYDPATGVWTAVAPMSQERYAHTATLLSNGKLFVVGGQNYGGAPSERNTAQLFDPASGLWADTANLMYRRTRHTASPTPGGVIVCGGTGELGVMSSCERYW